ncbi:hypothetical protein EON63_16790 [archaeon]|nr:MAG: hypothetical protein EON63_16790 [archaeon]
MFTHYLHTYVHTTHHTHPYTPIPLALCIHTHTPIPKTHTHILLIDAHSAVAQDRGQNVPGGVVY